MCGISGFIDPSRKLSKTDLKAMISTLNHRGPDNQNVEIFESSFANIGMAHARLSIIDLSNEANQPMSFKHLTITYNGEIYNFNEIKNELIDLGHNFSTHSDTEVILHAFEEWSVEAVDKFIGMFAFAIFDKLQNKIFIFKDRVGVKPLYYTIQNKIFLFSSELKSFMALDFFKKEINSEAVGYFFQLAYIPGPYTVFNDVYKLNGGEYLTYDIEKLTFEKFTYWDSIKIFQQTKKLKISIDDAKIKLKDILISSTKYRMIADVPVGVFLSGGYDSSLIAAILKKETNEKIKTYTIGFEIGNNEAPQAKTIANYLNTEHHEYYMNEEDAKKIIENLTYFYDEPFGDSSAIPTTFISQMASKDIKVILSADGGDEVFFGYNQLEQYGQYMIRINKIPNILSPLFSFLFNIFAYFFNKNSFSYRKFKLLSQILFLNKNKRNSFLFNSMFQSSSKFTVQNLMKSNVKEYSDLTLNSNDFNNIYDEYLALGYKNYLQHDILKKVDIATMTASIEGREPLLDHRLFEYVAQLPINFKYGSGVKKRILKEIMYENYLPKELIERPKTGFTVPIYDWLKGDLKYFIDNYCSDEALQESKLFDVINCRNYINKFYNNELIDNTIIWKLLIFQMWYKRWIIN